jgi:hypothetical protein
VNRSGHEKGSAGASAACAFPKEKKMWRKIAIALILGIIFLSGTKSANGIKADDMGDEETPGNQASNFVYQSEENTIKNLIHKYHDYKEVIFIKKINFGVPGGDNWIIGSSDKTYSDANGIGLYLIKDSVILSYYNLGMNFEMNRSSRFDIMKDIPGTHIGNGTSSIGDFNGDGLDEVFTYGFGGNGKFIVITGYETTTDSMQNYCYIPFDIIDPENGPAPVEFMTYKGMNGFKVYYVANDVAGGIGYVPDPMPDNRKWFFCTWDETTRKYVRVEEVVDEPPAVTEPIETTVVPPEAEPEAIEADLPTTEPVTVASNNLGFFVVIAVALLVGGILLVVLVLRKRRRKNA